MKAVKIPSAWLMGATHGGRLTLREAVAHWLDQQRMEQELVAARAGLDAYENSVAPVDHL